MIIAIDGPAAAGKGTLARRIAEALRLPYLDTGLLYRAVGRLVLDAGGDPTDCQAAAAAARALTQADLSRPDLRGPDADRAASAVAAIPEVRQALLDYQRSFGDGRGAVLDGRDIGTVVFPDAEVKLFVTASLAARAARRHAELGPTSGLATVQAELGARDAADAARQAAPLKPADDALIFDTTHLDADSAFTEALGLIRRRVATSWFTPLGLPIIETARLTLRPPLQEDFAAWSAFMADQDASRFIGGPQAAAISWRGMATVAGSWALNGYGMFSVIERETGRWIGRIGPWQPVDWPGPEIGYALVRHAWGKGYAHEATAAAIDWTLDRLGWSEFIHVIDPRNAASLALARRLGSIYRGPGRLPAPWDGEVLEIWGQTAARWHSRQTSRR